MEKDPGFRRYRLLGGCKGRRLSHDKKALIGLTQTSACAADAAPLRITEYGLRCLRKNRIFISLSILEKCF